MKLDLDDLERQFANHPKAIAVQISRENFESLIDAARAAERRLELLRPFAAQAQHIGVLPDDDEFSEFIERACIHPTNPLTVGHIRAAAAEVADAERTTR